MGQGRFMLQNFKLKNKRELPAQYVVFFFSFRSVTSPFFLLKTIYSKNIVVYLPFETVNICTSLDLEKRFIFTAVGKVSFCPIN